MLAGTTLALLLTAARAADPEAARAELAACADRIEELKAREEIGRELERLLRRAQELAAELDRAAGHVPAVPDHPWPEELRERADAARDEADLIAAELAALDVRIQDARGIHRAEAGGAVAGASLATPAPAPLVGGERLQALLAERSRLVRLRAHAEAAAAQLDAEARSAEGDR